MERTLLAVKTLITFLFATTPPTNTKYYSSMQIGRQAWWALLRWVCCTLCLENTIKLYNKNVLNMRNIIKDKKTPDHYYVCHMTETFSADGKRMVILNKCILVFPTRTCWQTMYWITFILICTHFSKRSLFPHMDADHDELPISTGDGTTSVMAHFIKGVDNRATLTKNWSSFFIRQTWRKGVHMLSPSSACPRASVWLAIQSKQVTIVLCYLTWYYHK